MSGLIPLGDPSAIACEGDACILPGVDQVAQEAVASVSVTEQITPGR